MLKILATVRYEGQSTNTWAPSIEFYYATKEDNCLILEQQQFLIFVIGA
jgi:hypothetical protein